MALLTNINGKFSVSDAGAVTFNNAFTFPTTDGTANYVLKTNGSGTVSWSPDSSPTVYWAANGNDIYNTNSANVGIGTNSPTSPTGVSKFLHISGSPTAGIVISDSDNADYNWDIWNSGGGLFMKYNDTTFGVCQLSSGNVGIGNTSPATKLSVGSASHTSPDDTNRILNWYTTTGGAEINNSNYYITVGQDSNSTSQPTSVGLALFNPNTANNTYSPALTFGGLSTSGNYMTGAAAIATKLIASSDTNFRGGDLKFYTSGITSATIGLTEKMVINTQGNVGIGTTAPDYKLEVESTAVAYLFSETTGAGGSSGFKWKTPDSEFSWYSSGGTNNMNLYDYTANAIRLTVNSSGNVGIGTDSPDFALDISAVDSGVQLQIGRTNTNVGSAWMGASGSGLAVGVGAYGAGNSVTDPKGFLIDASGNLSTRRRIQAKTDTGVGVAVTRNLFVTHGGNNFNYTFDPVALFGAALGGGKLLLEVTGWPERLNCGYIVWRNDGNGSGLIGTGVVSYVQTAVQSAGNVAVSLPSTGTNEITISFTGWHTNDHGWSCYIKNDF